MHACPKCKGSGREGAPMMGDIGGCRMCLGSGKIQQLLELCPTCKGEMFVWPSPDHCDRCKGTGYSAAAAG